MCRLRLKNLTRASCGEWLLVLHTHTRTHAHTQHTRVQSVAKMMPVASSAPATHTSASASTDQAGAKAYKATRDNLIVVRKLPTNGASMHDAICTELRPQDQMVVDFPGGAKIKSWLLEVYGTALREPPKTDEVWLRAWQGGIFPLPVGALLPSAEGTTREYSEPLRSKQRVSCAYVDECASHIGMRKTAASTTEWDGAGDRVVAPLPDTDQMVRWFAEHYADHAPPQEDEIKIVQWKGGLFPFEAGAFAQLAAR